MCTKSKSKWFPLISLGLLVVVFASSADHLTPWPVPDFFKGTAMGTGIGMEVLGLMLIAKERKRSNPS